MPRIYKLVLPNGSSLFSQKGGYNDEAQEKKEFSGRHNIEGFYGFNIHRGISQETQAKFDNGGYAPTYGELTQKGMEQMLENIDTRGKVYYDLGSGYGKTVLSAALNHGFRKAVGVELATERYEEAENVLNSLDSARYPEKRNIQYHNKDFFDPTVDVSDADVVFISSLCFPSKVLDGLSKKLEQELKPGAYVFSSKELHAPKLRSISSKPVKMTWQNRSNVYGYLVSPY